MPIQEQKTILAENLRTLMRRATRRELRTQIGVHDVTGVGQNTVGRILRGQCSPTVETLAIIAEPFGVETWQILIPHFDPTDDLHQLVKKALER